MNPTVQKAQDLTEGEAAILAEVLEFERAKLMIGIRHSVHRAFRDELRHRLDLVESLMARFGSAKNLSGEAAAPGA